MKSVTTPRIQSPAKRFLRDSFWCFVFCVLVNLAWNAWPRSIPLGESFSLQSPLLGWVFNTLTLFLIIDIPVAFLHFSGDHIPARPAIRRMCIVMTALPLAIGGIFLQFGRYDTVFVGDDKISLRGSSPLGECQFRTKDIGIVHLKHQGILTELIFEWYDTVYQSVWIAPFDSASKENLARLIDALSEEGIEVHEVEPEGVRKPPFRSTPSRHN